MFIFIICIDSISVYIVLLAQVVNQNIYILVCIGQYTVFDLSIAYNKSFYTEGL